MYCIHRVMNGDVLQYTLEGRRGNRWYCSFHSNMQWSVSSKGLSTSDDCAVQPLICALTKCRWNMAHTGPDDCIFCGTCKRAFPVWPVLLIFLVQELLMRTFRLWELDGYGIRFGTGDWRRLSFTPTAAFQILIVKVWETSSAFTFTSWPGLFHNINYGLWWNLFVYCLISSFWGERSESPLFPCRQLVCASLLLLLLLQLPIVYLLKISMLCQSFPLSKENRRAYEDDVAFCETVHCHYSYLTDWSSGLLVLSGCV